MFGELIRSGVALGDRPALIAADAETSWRSLADHAEGSVSDLSPLAGSRVGMMLQPTPCGFAALAALDRLRCEVFLLDGRGSAEYGRRLSVEIELDALVTTDEGQFHIERLSQTARGSGESSVTILTSGTTGKPKAARHTWDGLARPIRRTATDEVQRWLLSYRPNLYAGLQVLLQCWVNRGTLVVDDSQGDPAALARLMVRRKVGYVSATPSYWRQLFLWVDPALLAEIPLAQATLGGEVVDQPILTALATTFPTARIVHIYATTELGRCFSVTDAQSGFPKRFLDGASPDGVRMKIDDGELLVQSANRMRAYDAHSAGGVEISPDGWVRTGDLVSLRDDRVYFVGRRSDMINAGGNKISPIAVENAIRQTPGVADVRVFAVPSSIAGQLVACEIVPATGCDPAEVQRAVARHCRETLASHERPRMITMVERIELTGAGKVRRGAASGEPTNNLHTT